MKKALQTTIAGTLFTIEEDAFDKLKSYLDSIKSYFGKLPDSDDVIVDIEARISEQLTEGIEKSNNIVTIASVEKVIEQMGSVEEITGESDFANEAEQIDSYGPKKLFRDSEDVAVAGVASGMAIYFGMDTLLMRIIFITLLFITSGGFIFIYLILALLVPKAITPADKLRMRGGPTTLSSFKESFDEQIKNVKENGADLISKESAFRKNLKRILSFFGVAVRLTAKVIIKAIGIILIVVPVLMAVGMALVISSLIFNSDILLNGTPIFEVISTSLYYCLILIGSIVAIIPAIFLASIGSTILSGKIKMKTVTAISLVCIWFLALIIGSTLSVRYIPNIEKRVDELQKLHQNTQEPDQNYFLIKTQ